MNWVRASQLELGVHVRRVREAVARRVAVQ